MPRQIVWSKKPRRKGEPPDEQLLIDDLWLLIFSQYLLKPTRSDFQKGLNKKQALILRQVCKQFKRLVPCQLTYSRCHWCHKCCLWSVPHVIRWPTSKLKFGSLSCLYEHLKESIHMEIGARIPIHLTKEQTRKLYYMFRRDPQYDCYPTKFLFQIGWTHNSNLKPKLQEIFSLLKIPYFLK